MSILSYSLESRSRLNLVQALRSAAFQIWTISKSSLRAPHSGQVQFMGTWAQGVPAAIPCSGAPVDSS